MLARLAEREMSVSELAAPYAMSLAAVSKHIRSLERASLSLGLLGVGQGHALVYRWLAQAWPRGVLARGLRLAVLVYFLSFVFWEFFTPFNQLGEPLPLIALELTFWAVIALCEGLAIAAVMESRRAGYGGLGEGAGRRHQTRDKRQLCGGQRLQKARDRAQRKWRRLGNPCDGLRAVRRTGNREHVVASLFAGLPYPDPPRGGAS